MTKPKANLKIDTTRMKRAYVRKPKPSPQETATKAVSKSLAECSRVIIVHFGDNTQTYAYHTRDESIQVGDFAIVISPYSSRNTTGFATPELGGYPTIVKVVDVKETVHSVNMASKWIIQKLDLRAAIEEAQRKEAIEVLRAKITKARKAAEERVKLEQLRELSPELDDLLNQYDALTGA